MTIDYKSVTVRDLKRMVNRGEASPTEIGLFVAYDTWERESGRRAIVTNELLRWIEEKWRFKPYANELDYWVDFGKHLVSVQYRANRESVLFSLALVTISVEMHYAYGMLYGATFKALYKQALEHGLQIPGLTEEQAAALAATVSETPDYRVSTLTMLWEKLRGDLAKKQAISNVLIDAEAFLDIPLATELEENLAFTRERLIKERAGIEQLAKMDPRAEVLLSGSGDYESVEADPETEATYTELLTQYLPVGWREWAQAGIKLRDVAPKARSIAEAAEILGSANITLDDIKATGTIELSSAEEIQ
jgi:hypothetical protein